MKLVRIAKMMPDPSAMHIMGAGKVARKLKKPKFEQPALFGDTAEGYQAQMKVNASASAAKRAKAAKRRQEAFRRAQS